MISYYTPTIHDPWTEEDLRRYEREGSQRDKIIYNSYHNAKLRLFGKNLYLCSFKQKNEGYKNIYVHPVTMSTFLFLAYFPQIDGAVELRKYEGIATLLDKLPLLGEISRNLESKGEIKVNDDLSIVKGGVCLIVHAPFGQFLFPKHKKIEIPEIIKKYSILTGLYAQLSKEYEALGNAINQIADAQKAREEKLKYLLTKQIIKTGIKIGLYATGVGAGLAALMEIDDYMTAGDAIDTISTLSDLDNLSDVTDILDVADMADGLADAETLADFSDLSDMMGIDDFDIPNDFDIPEEIDIDNPDPDLDPNSESIGVVEDRNDASDGDLSFRGKTETKTIKRTGGSNITKDVQIEKVDGSSTTFKVKVDGVVKDIIKSDKPGTVIVIDKIHYKIV